MFSIAALLHDGSKGGIAAVVCTRLKNVPSTQQDDSQITTFPLEALQDELATEHDTDNVVEVKDAFDSRR